MITGCGSACRVKGECCHLYAVVTAVSDNDVSLAAHTHAPGTAQLPLPVSLASQLHRRRADSSIIAARPHCDRKRTVADVPPSQCHRHRQLCPFAWRRLVLDCIRAVLPVSDFGTVADAADRDLCHHNSHFTVNIFHFTYLHYTTTPLMLKLNKHLIHFIIKSNTKTI